MRFLWLPAVLLVALAAVVPAYLQVVALGYPFDWDEANHAMQGVRIADDLRRAAWFSFAFDTYRQVYWPPLHSWYLAAIFLVTEPSFVTARLGSLVALVGTAVCVGLIVRQQVAGVAGSVGAVAGAAVLVASGGVLVLATQAMIELPGLFLLAVSLWLFGRGLRGGHWAWVGLAIATTYLMKSNYGVLLAGAIGLALVIDRRWRALAWTAGAAALPLAVWFAYLPKIDRSIRALSNFPLGPDRFSPEGLLFYPRALVWLAGSWPMLLLWGLVLVLSLAALRQPVVRLVVIFVVLQAVAAQLAVTKVDRHILPLALLLALLAGYWAARAWCSRLRWGLAAGALLIVWQAALLLPTLRPPTDPAALAIGRAAIDALAFGGVLIAAKDVPPAPAGFDFQLIRDEMPFSGAGSLIQADEDRLIAVVTGRLPAGDRLAADLDRWPAGSRWTTYIGLPLDSPRALGQTNFSATLAARLRRAPVDRVVFLLRTPPVDYPWLTPEWVNGELAGLGFTLESEQRLVLDTTLLRYRVLPSRP